MQNRKIAFRAWDDEDKKMKSWYDMMFSWGSDLMTERSMSDVFAFKGLHFMQFTGLTDKNGKEIYEGDVVKPSGGDKYRFPIIWEELKDEDGYGMAQGFGISKELADQSEIVGNIYENPELLGTS